MTKFATLIADAQAHCDPTANHGSIGALVRSAFFSQGFQLLTMWRLGAGLHRANRLLRLLSKPILALQAVLFGCYINPNARLGPGVNFPHPVGIVIGAGVKIGARTVIYQNVTLGARRMNEAGYPVVGTEAILYAGAVVIGGIELGDRSRVGANAVLMESIPHGATATGNPAHVRSPHRPIAGAGDETLHAA